MEPILALTAEDMEKIEYLRRAETPDRAFNSNHWCDTGFFLRYWNTAKRTLFKMFGKQLILSKPVNVVITDDTLWDKMRCLCYSPEMHDFFKKLTERLNEVDGFNVNDTVISRRYYNITYEEILASLVDTESCFYNEYKYDDVEFPIPGSTKKFKLTRGMKTFRALSKFAKYYDLTQEFEIVRLKHSQILNENTFNGDLCLSIHPLDYMTASFNNNDWRSCMNWEDGEYRRGVVEMMNSEAVVCAYLKSGHDTLDLGYAGEWNSKKWREFFIVNEDVVSGIKGYPYWNHIIEKIALDWLRELAIQNLGYDYEDNCISWGDNSEKITVNNVACSHPIFECGPAMYNDFCYENGYISYFSPHYSEMKNYVYDYSGRSECICCGDEEENFEGESCLVCSTCYEPMYCACCGDPIDEDYNDYEQLSDGYYYCSYCIDNMPRCVVCDEKVPWDHGMLIDIGDSSYHAAAVKQCVCKDCLTSYKVFKDVDFAQGCWQNTDDYEIGIITVYDKDFYKHNDFLAKYKDNFVLNIYTHSGDNSENHLMFKPEVFTKEFLENIFDTDLHSINFKKLGNKYFKKLTMRYQNSLSWFDQYVWRHIYRGTNDLTIIPKQFHASLFEEPDMSF